MSPAPVRRPRQNPRAARKPARGRRSGLLWLWMLVLLVVALGGLAGAGLIAYRVLRSGHAIHIGSLRRIMHEAETRHPNSLWHVVHDLCVPDAELSGRPDPCVKVDLTGGYAVIKDPERPTQFLLIPTRRIVGIESPDLLQPGSPNYWRAAWDARHYLDDQVGRPIPREDVGLAINSAPGRTQNQLHIHIDCLRPEVAADLVRRADEIGQDWRWLRGLGGETFRARWIAGEDLGGADPFKLLAKGVPLARQDMADQTLVLVGAQRRDGAPGFILLTAQADAEAAGEVLLDHHCELMQP